MDTSASAVDSARWPPRHDASKLQRGRALGPCLWLIICFDILLAGCGMPPPKAWRPPQIGFPRPALQVEPMSHSEALTTVQTVLYARGSAGAQGRTLAGRALGMAAASGVTLLPNSPPPRPITNPAGPGPISVEVGGMLSVCAKAAAATQYKWLLQGAGEISSTHPQDCTIFGAGKQENTQAVLTVTAYNELGASPPATLKLSVIPSPRTRAPLDTLATPLVSISSSPNSVLTATIHTEDCYSAPGCLRLTYPSGALVDWSSIFWVPRCLSIVDITCRKGAGASDPLVCIASIKTQSLDELRRGMCVVNILEAGRFGLVSRLSFWARGSQGGEKVEFRVGDPDLLPRPGRTTRLTLEDKWRRYAIPLEGLNLTATSALFVVALTSVDNTQGADFYLDDIQFEGVMEGTGQSPSEQQRFTDSLSQLCWVAYSPTHYDPSASPIQWPSEDDVRQDFRVLRQAGFDGLVTYSSALRSQTNPGRILDVAALAQEAGFEQMIVGVSDPASEQELRAAEQAGRYPLVLGYSVGNEGLDERYDLETLTGAMQRLRQVTGKPVTTTEQAGDYAENSPLWTISDWIFPNVHPYFSHIREPEEAVSWSGKIFATMDGLTNKAVVFKEVGLPSGGDVDVSEDRQALYYRLMRETDVWYVVFEAFDAPWKHLGLPNPDGTYSQPDPEPHWGIFTSDRRPKLAADDICRH